VPECKKIFGGAEVDMYIMGCALSDDKKFEVSFVVADYGQEPVKKIDNVALIKSLDFASLQIVSAVKVWRAMSRSKANVFMMETMSPGLLLLYVFSLLKRKKYVFRTSHTNHCDGTYLNKHKFLAWLYKRAIRGASVLITQNQDDASGIRRLYGVEPVVIPNAHKLGRPLGDRDDHILWVARSAGFKNPYLFIKLAEAIPELNFRMICPRAFDDHDYDRLKAAAQKIKNLEFIDGVSFFEVEKYFSRANMFVNTSDNEGFPNTFVQAAKAGVPIVSYKVNPDDFLIKYDCGRCAGGDFNKLTEMVRRLAADRQLNKSLGENAFKYAFECHNIDQIVEDYKKIFEKTVGNG
jgi:glycosyltransferase involved in cell wall biosynthesis